MPKWIPQWLRYFYLNHQNQDWRDDQIVFYYCIRISTSCIQFVYRLSISTDTRIFAVSWSNFYCQLFVKMNPQCATFQSCFKLIPTIAYLQVDWENADDNSGSSALINGHMDPKSMQRCPKKRRDDKFIVEVIPLVKLLSMTKKAKERNVILAVINCIYQFSVRY